MERARMTIVLELDEAADCPGCARVPGGPTHEFHGWIGLTEAIDALTGVHRAVVADGSTQRPASQSTP